MTAPHWDRPVPSPLDRLSRLQRDRAARNSLRFTATGRVELGVDGAAQVPSLLKTLGIKAMDQNKAKAIVDHTLVPHTAFQSAVRRIEQCFEMAEDASDPICI